VKYEELYTRNQFIIDELAERILTLGETPLSRFSDYLIHSVIAENDLITEAKRGVDYVLSAQKQLLIVERELLKLSETHQDEGSSALMSDLIREKEKNKLDVFIMVTSN